MPVLPRRDVERNGRDSLRELRRGQVQCVCGEHRLQRVLPVRAQHLQRRRGCCVHALRERLLCQRRRGGVLPPGQLERKRRPHLHAVRPRDILHNAGRHGLIHVHPV